MTASIRSQDIQRVLAEDLPWHRLDGATVLITGAGGFLPGQIVDVLLARNTAVDRHERTQVIGLVRDLTKAESRFRSNTQDGLSLIAGDASRPPAIDGPIDFVIHAASPATPTVYSVDPVGVWSVNALGTAALLDVARERDSRGFLLISSGEVYGVVDSAQVPMKESTVGLVDQLQVRSCYAEGKRAAENACVAWAHQHAVNAVIARPFHTYGPGMPLADGRVFSDFVDSILRRAPIRLLSDGRARRAFCYSADAVAGFFTALLLGAKGEAYNVGNPDAETSILELANTLVAAFPERSLRLEHAARPTGSTYLESPISRNSPNVDRLKALGWGPRTGIVDGFRRTVTAFEQDLGQD